jgi:predicted GNAT superfamily acetyltransferase
MAVIRELDSAADYEACGGLQRRVWGDGYRDVVPGSLIKVSREVGGLCAGAFGEDGELVGFVYGLTGVRSGRVVHWSHMLAVDPAHRDRGIGQRLKSYQRDRLSEAGVGMMYWTFDPLVARNGHLNLNRLGVRIEAYEPDMYPGTGSDLHAFGTDRLVASWSVRRSAPDANGGSGDTSAFPVWRGDPPSPDEHAMRVEIPADAESMRSGSLGELREWRRSTREAFTVLLGLGWKVTGFAALGARRFYILHRHD